MQNYELIVVGTGFASSFFLHEYLRLRDDGARVLVLEKGEDRPHAWQLEDPTAIERASRASIESPNREKDWRFSIALGGGSNCWWAVAPRLHPNDFRIRSLYGVGRDWPLSYDDLEPWYVRAERAMAVSGPDDAPFPRSAPYPLPPHRLSAGRDV